ncbi:Crp/Fnr family transcriptional regulator [Ovoidimarina sediminis]|uniref:Crp/Fnr family transcriptional regulator n=1 Tax=Ovoidimarina sediminis TaxID=3079856 RepID=UPI0029124CF3|nr:cyclic nucleotide-binding domain-containing protein [Rhodophyticola sp. MJ-SS7]MDU8942365.1 cyclic nucleotide-binding domain-containing protein [Rhodophyticola sp. MJ-SS7]
MELSLESAFSTGGLVGHLAYILLILSIIMRNIVWLRIFMIVSSLVAIAYALIWLSDPVSSFWETLMVTVNVVQLLIIWRENSRARFTAVERDFAARRLRGLATGEQRRILNMGTWETLEDGTVLTENGVHPPALIYIAEGTVDVMIDGRQIATCGPGDYVGEMSLVGGAPASADTRVRGAALVWRLPAAAIDDLDRRKPAWLAVIEAGIARNIRRKLIAANAAQLA